MPASPKTMRRRRQSSARWQDKVANEAPRRASTGRGLPRIALLAGLAQSVPAAWVDPRGPSLPRTTDAGSAAVARLPSLSRAALPGFSGLSPNFGPSSAAIPSLASSAVPGFAPLTGRLTATARGPSPLPSSRSGGASLPGGSRASPWRATRTGYQEHCQR